MAIQVQLNSFEFQDSDFQVNPSPLFAWAWGDAVDQWRLGHPWLSCSTLLCLAGDVLSAVCFVALRWPFQRLLLWAWEGLTDDQFNSLMDYQNQQRALRTAPLASSRPSSPAILDLPELS
ncbi:hypothetical protein CCR95_06245 [Thiocystis minor]|uniref:hypothetical protein n=1 Tax=Thiocystis minor TaxID=61597 RepID=UPI001912F262|nr:hypothetical protein [Thiocystis minor]MBK5963694.1 hypothetical protein [Thiocystis minor]